MKLLVVTILAMFTAFASNAFAEIKFKKSDGTYITVQAGNYTGTVSRQAINGDVHYYITCTSGNTPMGVAGTLEINPPESSLSTAEADLLGEGDRENDSDNYAQISVSGGTPAVASTGTGSPYP